MRTPASPSAPSTFVGRDRELGVLRAHLDATLAGQGSLVLIGGEAGIGKTVLAEALCQEAREQGALVLVGRCYDLTETPPYGPWAELFGHYDPTDSMPPLPTAFAQRGTLSAVTSQAALMQQVLDFVIAVSSHQPLLLLFDDLHWADPASLDLLRVAARNLADHAALLLVTYRAHEVTRRHPLYTHLPMLEREARATRLDLRRLSDDAIRLLIGARYHLSDRDEDRLLSYLHERAEGNALFIMQLLRVLEEEDVLHPLDGWWTLGDPADVGVPVPLRQVIDVRVMRLGEEGHRLLSIAAVIGQEVPVTAWTAVTDEDERTILDLVDRAHAAHILEVPSDGAHVRFAHALIREALYEGISPVQRRRWHRTIGETLAAMATANPDLVANHFVRAGDARAVTWLIKAGERAQAAYAWVTAAARYEGALALMAQANAPAQERGWLLARSSRLIQFVDVAKARALAEEACILARTAKDRGLAAFTRYQCGVLACFAGDVARGLPEMEEAADAMGELTETERAHYTVHAPPFGAAGRVPDGRGGVAMWRPYVGRYREARELGEQLIAEVRAGGEEVLQNVKDGIYGLGDAYAALGMPDEATAMFTIAHDAYLRADHPAVAALASWLELELVALPYRTDDITRRQQLAERAEREHRRASGALSTTVPPRFLRVSLLVIEGEWEEAEQLAAAVSVEARGLIHYRMMALRSLGTLTLLRGDAERARWAVGEGLPAGPATEPRTVWPFEVVTALQRVAAALALDAEDLEAAAGWLSAHDRWLASSEAVLGRSEGQTLWAHYQRVAGNADQAHEYARRALVHASEPRQPLALIAAHRLLGELDTAARRFDDAQHHLAEALALAEVCHAPFEQALTRLALAELRAAAGDTAAATALIDDMRAVGERLRAMPILARVDALAIRLAARGGPPDYPAGLSSREVEVLRLVAQGRTNRDIADALFLSEHTVRHHLTHILAKTDTANRAEAAAFALRHGLA